MTKNEVVPVLTDASADYLKAIWQLSRRAPASTSAVAERLGVSAASVSGMLVRLSEAGWVRHVPYRGATLTETGRREAMRLLRRHRLVETFMIQRLGYGWDEVHDEAEALEHAVSDRFAESLADLLGHPTHDPHGDPIPTREGTLPDTPDVPLDTLPDGATLVVARLLSQNGDVLAYLAEGGVQPGAHVRIDGREPLGGTLHLDVDGMPFSLSRVLAERVRGEIVTR